MTRGYIDDVEESWLQTTVDVDGQQETLTFWWKVSSEEDCDYLQFYIDGQLQHQISGEVAWQLKSYDVSGAGSHTLKWVYVKDESDYENDDCGRVDWVLWSGAPDPTPDPPPDPTKWNTIDYTYDPGGRRIEKTVDDKYTTKYCYDGGNVIAEYDYNNNLLRKYIYGPGVDEPVCMIDAVDNDAEYYYHRDGLGSVVALSDSNGDTVQTYEYSVYGQVAASEPEFLTNPYMFTGRRFDLETGLYYYRARYYNPHIGRFMQTDPIGYGDGMNWYLYCGNNPLAFVDPSGLYSTATKFALFKIFWDAYDFCDVDVDESIDSAIATGLVWADVLVLGENGRMDVFDLVLCRI